MSIEVIGLFTHRDASETHPRPMGEIDTDFIQRAAQAFERNDFDRILIAQAATWPDGIVFASYVAAFTQKLKFMIAHRPGFIAPTMAARMLATIDQISHGRCAVHIISAANDIETQADGDFITRDERHVRSGEYIEVMRKVWRGETFDFDGDFFKFRGAHSTVAPANGKELPVFFGGMSEQGLATAGQYADVYAFGIKDLAESATLIAGVRAEAAKHGRAPRFLLSTRIILGATEPEAWAKADGVLQQVLGSLDAPPEGPVPSSPDRETLAAEGAVLDERLWIGVSKATNFKKASTTIVGTPPQVVEALLRYYDLGVTHFIISGYDLLPDLEEFGRDLIPLLRREAAVRG